MLAALVLAGCAGNPDRVVLLPQPDGSASTVIVRSKAGKVVLDKPYATASVRSDHLNESSLSKAEVSKRYQAVMDALPPRPRIHTVYFELGSTNLRSDSYVELAAAVDDIKKMPLANATIIGHADATGTDTINDKLSRQRAEKVRDLFIKNGASKDRIETVGRGSREPVVRTGRSVDEPKNRRAEIRID